MSENPRERVVKIVLWALMGILCVVSVARFFTGLGATTSLSDTTPWGLWVAFDVMAGVALSAGGFVIAAMVYVFKLDRYRPFVRPAILTAFLGYIAEVVGLLYDLGLPWHIWHPIIYPQPHSALFVVAMCCILCLPLLFLEFSPVILENPRFDKPFLRSIHKVLEKRTVVLVILGVVVATLHQSSLGSLFLIAPHRLHPLWYSPNIWILFFISALGLGIMMVTLEAFFSAWLLHHRLNIKPLSSLAKVAAVVLFLYAGLRLGDLAVRGELHRVWEPTPLSFLFGLELLLSALLPAVLLSIPRIRNHGAGLVIAAAMAVLGIVGYRFNVCIVAFDRPADMSYFPSFSEIAVSAGIVAMLMLVFIFFGEHLRVFTEPLAEKPPKLPPETAFHPSRMGLLLPPAMAYKREYSLWAIIGAAVALGLLPSSAILGKDVVETPVAAPMEVPARLLSSSDGRGHTFTILADIPLGSTMPDVQPVMLIDGNRNGRLVLFPHEKHKEVLGMKASCTTCHHQNVPFKLNTSCATCHRDMYLESDIFNHTAHIEKLQGKRSCARCHTDTEAVKRRETATKCETCHAHMPAPGSIIAPPKERMTGIAEGYADAMHGLCVKCHEKKTKEDPSRFGKWFKGCANCHRDTSERDLLKIAPYVEAVLAQ